MNARPVVTAAEPLRAFGLVPQRADEAPRISAIVGAEKPAWQRAGPQASRLVRTPGLEAPDLFQGRRIAGFDRDVLERRHCTFLPAASAITGAVELHAKVTKVERGVDGA